MFAHFDNHIETLYYTGLKHKGNEKGRMILVNSISLFVSLLSVTNKTKTLKCQTILKFEFCHLENCCKCARAQENKYRTELDYFQREANLQQIQV